jgi:GTPase SAR1 family protein
MAIVKFVFLGGQHAGKTSILRRYFHGTFYGERDGRHPTIGSDVYSTLISSYTPWLSSMNNNDKNEKKDIKDVNITPRNNGNNNNANESDSVSISSVSTEIQSSNNNKNKNKRPISIQIWDTPGRERFVNPDENTRYTASFSDNFLRNLDAVVLVYDVSSSTSFTHVLNWYYELIERIKRMKINHDRIRNLPIVIVGNKIDIFEERDTQKELRKKEVVQQRDVLGLTGNWTGRDYRYEYSASPPSTSSTMSSTTSKPSQHELLTYYLGTNTNYLEAILNNEVDGGSYLDSLVSSEDKSHPDKDMVQLWCMVSEVTTTTTSIIIIISGFSFCLLRTLSLFHLINFVHFILFMQRNGLIHMDVSAKSGVGIDKLIHELVDIALKQMDDKTIIAIKNNNDNDTDILRTNTLQRNDELDLHQRYSPKSTSCFPFQCCCK